MKILPKSLILKSQNFNYTKLKFTQKYLFQYAQIEEINSIAISV